MNGPLNRCLSGVALVLTDAAASGAAYGTGVMPPEAAAFAAGVSLAGLALTARSLADLLLPPEPARDADVAA